MNAKNEIWARALRMIEIRPHSAGELTEKLNREFKGEEEIIGQTIGEMQRVHLLNDRRVAELFVAHWIQKGIGRMKMQIETRRKHLQWPQIEQLLLDEGWSEEEAARKCLNEKERTLNEKEPRKRKQKLMRFLQSRGFTDRTIFRILGEQ